VYRQHVVALGDVKAINRDSFSRDTPGMLQLFGELHRQGRSGSPRYRNTGTITERTSRRFVTAGVDGFEIVNCAPKGLAFPPAARRDVLELAARHDLLVTGASDNHGWGR